MQTPKVKKKMATLFHEDGRVEQVSPLDKSRGFTRADMQRLLDARFLEMVDGVEMVEAEPKTKLLKGNLCFRRGGLRVRTGMVLVFDEEGRSRNKSLNLSATQVYACHCEGDGYVVGRALWMDIKALEQ